MDFTSVLDELRQSPRFSAGLVHDTVVPAQPSRPAPFPPGLDPRLVEVLRKRGIRDLYSHQARAIEEALAGRDFVVVTPTASGKTLCYNIPVLQSILEDPEARALYLFPTKALSQDQLAELHETTAALPGSIKTYTYDGDTPSNVRRTVRLAANIVVTNPDMLHSGVLPHHTKWVKLFENLRYVVIDEIHQYRGVFGSHLANVMRRLERICRFYGSKPQFIACSATIKNPRELASQVIGRELTEITENGAPRGARHLWLYNPPVVNAELGVRRSSIKEAAALGVELIRRGIQTILFARGRMQVEVLLTYVREGLRRHHKNPDVVRGYRGGYLPQQRREIERGLRAREYLGVVTTNALELGIDIGGMDACIVSGYPGSIASILQQWGRAGRRQGPSLALLIGTSNPLDQYLLDHPEHLLGASPEAGIIHADNLVIRVNQIKCAAFELPFERGEKFGGDEDEGLGEVLEFLEEHRVLRRVGERWHWMTDVYPAQDVSLRSASAENFVIFDTGDRNKALGEVDFPSAPFMIHEQAIYIHEEKQYVIEKLDWENRQAFAKPVKVDYYTDAEGKSEVKVLETFLRTEIPGGDRCMGEVAVTTLPVQYKKIRFHTHENLGWGRITLPELEIQTTSYWLSFDPAILEGTLRDRFGGGEKRALNEILSAGIKSLGNVLGAVAPLFVLCDPRDLRTVVQVNSPFMQRPTIFLYDNFPAGVGLAERLYAAHDEILAAAAQALARCGCPQGCPSCVGPPLSVGEHGKEAARVLLGLMGIDLGHFRPFEATCPVPEEELPLETGAEADAP